MQPIEIYTVLFEKRGISKSTPNIPLPVLFNVRNEALKTTLFIISKLYEKPQYKKEWTLLSYLADKELKGEPYATFCKP